MPVKGNWFEGRSRLWAERLRIIDKAATIVVARYGATNGWLDEQPAITLHPFGRGFVYFVGVYLDDAAQDKLLEHILLFAGVKGFPAPAGVEVSVRVRPDGEQVYVVINHVREERVLTLPWPGRDHLTGAIMAGAIQLPPYAVMVITQQA